MEKQSRRNGPWCGRGSPRSRPHLDGLGPKIVVARPADGTGLAQPGGVLLDARHADPRASRSRRLLLACLLVLLGGCVGAGTGTVLELSEVEEVMRAVEGADFTTVSSSRSKLFRTYRKVGKDQPCRK